MRPDEGPDADRAAGDPDEALGRAIALDPLFSPGEGPDDGLDADAAMRAYQEAALLSRGRRPDVARRAFQNWGNLLLQRRAYRDAAARFSEAVAADAEDASVRNDLGRALAGAGDVAAAMQAYEEAARLWKARGSADAKFALQNLGNLLLEDKRYPEAEARLREAVAADPLRPSAHNDLGRALAGAGDAAAAMQAHEQAARLWQAQGSTDAKFALQDLGNLFLEDKRYKEAEARLREAIALDAEDASVHNDLGRALAGAGDAAGAMQAHEHAARLWQAQGSTDAKFALQDLGELLLEGKRYREAEARFREAVAADADGASAHNDLGRALAGAGDTDAAMQAYEEAARLWQAQGSADARFALQNLGNLLLHAKRFKEAEARFREALAADPQQASVVNDLGRALAGANEPAAAMQAYEQAARLWREQGSSDARIALQNWGKLLLEGRDYKGAEARLREAIAIDPLQASALNDLGRALAGAGDHAAAMQAYEQAARRWQALGSSDSRFALQNWGYLLKANDDVEQAVSKLREAVDIDPTDASSWFDLGNGLADASQHDEAIQAYRRSASLDPKDPYARHNCASTLMDLGRYREGWTEWEAAREVYEACVVATPKSRLEIDRVNYFAGMLADIFGDWPAAESRFRSILQSQPGHADALVGLVSLYAGWGESDRPLPGAMARQPLAVRQAGQALRSQLGLADDGLTMIALADLATTAEDLAEAEDWLDKAGALARDLQSRKTAIAARRGVLHSRQARFEKAIGCFQQALRAQPDNLKLRTNLAEALVKAKQTDRAESEYRRVLSLAPNNVEARIGLGQLCIDLAEGGDSDRLLDAETHLMAAIDCGAASRAGSKRLRGRELGQVHYLLGYARVKMFEVEPGPRALYQLQAAEKNFAVCKDLDRANYKAPIALAKLRKRLFAARRDQFAEWFGPALVCLLSITVFGYAHYDFHVAAPALRRLTAAEYIAVTFGSLVFFVAGLYLPKVLKLKVPGIELEKASVDQISVATSIGIRR